MAKARNAGVSGAAVAATILAIFFIFALVAAIIFHTQSTKVRLERDDLATKLAALATPEEQRLPAIESRIANRDAGTVIGQFIAEVDALRRFAAADTNVDSANLRKRMDSLKVSSDLLSEVSKLQAELRKAEEKTKLVEGNLAEAQQRAEEADKARAALAGQFNSKVEELQGEIAKLQSAMQQYQGTVTQAQGDLEGTIENVRTEMQGKVDEKDTRIVELEAQLAEEKRLNDRLRSITRELATDTTIKPDGQIAAMVEKESLVYINLGREQHVVPGLTFEVFDPGTVIKPDEFSEVRGKATIEIAKVEPSTASARIVRVERGENIKLGDKIVNLAFDPTVTYQFYVYGDFDIDNTGEASLSDRKRIEAMVGKFGAVIAPELSYEVDYLVLGAEPDLPPPLPADTLDPEVIAANVAARRKYEVYQQLVGEAKELRIPVLNQNRFLALVGYYER